MARAASLREGYCETTDAGNGGNCQGGKKGSFSVPESIKTWEQALTFCEGLCTKCDRCQYISLSLEWHDCSWFHACDMEHLSTAPAGFYTFASVQPKVRFAHDPASAPPVGRGQFRGYCAITTLDLGDCQNGMRGAFRLGDHRVYTLDECAAHCKATCARCNFVSYSQIEGECAWHHECPQPRWAHVIFVTRQVRLLPSANASSGSTDLALALMPPPPPTARLPPPSLAAGMRPGYCAVMSGRVGDCARDDQGAFSEARTVEECMAYCLECASCRYVSMDLTSLRTRIASNGMTGSLGDAIQPQGRPRWVRREHAPFWWPCRWYRRCDLYDLRQTAHVHDSYVTWERPASPLPAVMPSNQAVTASVQSSAQPSPAQQSSAATNAPPTRPIRLALVTLAARAPKLSYGYDVKCALMQWCLSARRLEAALGAAFHVTRHVLTSGPVGWLNRSAGCELHLLPIATALRAAASACATTVARSSYALMAAQGLESGYVHDTPYFKEMNMLKWQLYGLRNHDVVCFADADLELAPFAEANAALLARAWTSAVKNLMRSEALLVADPDALAPLNTGWMLLKPSQVLFEDGIRVLQRCQFNRSAGWDLRGPPSVLDVQPLVLDVDGSQRQDRSRHAPSAGLAALHRSRAYQRDTWDFTSSDCDQGLFFYLLYVRHRRGALGSPGRTPRNTPYARHWWASYKPWRTGALGNSGGGKTQAEYARAIAYEDPAALARLYDYIGRVDAPFDDMELHEAALLRGSRCWQGQTALRRAIESNYSHFFEVEEVWRAMDGGGPGWVPLPM